MEKTVVIVCGNTYSAAAGEQISIDTNQTKGVRPGPPPVKVITKTAWTHCVEAVTEYCRIVFDLFPDKYQVCVAAADQAKCQPINTWRDEDQELGRVQSGFQKFGLPQLQPASSHPHGPLTSTLQGLQFGMRCLAQLTATQYAHSISPVECQGIPANRGRIILYCTIISPAEKREIEKAALDLLRAENADIRHKNDPARLQIQSCEVIVMNVCGTGVVTEIKDTPIVKMSPDCLLHLHTYDARNLVGGTLDLVKEHFNLKSTVITNIPMREEQSGGGSFNYDVELIHFHEAHRDILRAGYVHSMAVSGKQEAQQTIYLKWSTPKTGKVDLQYCSSVYRVTPMDVTSRPTICLVNFVLSGKPVVLEQPKKGNSKVVSHILISHGGAIFLHCLPVGRTYLDDPPSISEGWGGRITDYRISDFSQLVSDNCLVPHLRERTKIPSLYPIQLAIQNLERETRYWPMVFNDTVVFSMSQELEPFLTLIHSSVLTDTELEECKKVIMGVQMREANNEPLPLPSGSGRSKGSKRDEQYRQLWSEIENMSWLYATLSDKHRALYDYVTHVVASSPSMQYAHKAPHLDTPALEESSKAENDTGRAVPRAAPVNGEKASRPLPLLPGKPVASLLSIWTTKMNAKASSKHPEFKGRMNPHSNIAELYTSLSSKSGSVIPLTDQDS